MEKLTEKLNFKISASQRKAINELAEKENRTEAGQIRQLIDEALVARQVYSRCITFAGKLKPETVERINIKLNNLPSK